MNIYHNFSILLSSWFFIGYAPCAPGTFGSIFAIPLCYILSKLSKEMYFFSIATILIIAIMVSSTIEKHGKKKDPNTIVIDEVVGMVVTLLMLPFRMDTVFWGFIIFRFIDIVKPQPIDFVDKKMKGGFGIVFDDILGGFASNLILRLLLF